MRINQKKNGRQANVFQKTLAHALGWICLTVGVIGLFLPILQGIILIVIGLTFLSVYNVYIHRHLHTQLSKYPTMQKRAYTFEAAVVRLFGQP
jgi:uncharacterized membrane protein YbaN (DUF454 family)